MINEREVSKLLDALQELQYDRVKAKDRYHEAMKNRKNANTSATLFCVILPVFLYLNLNHRESHINTFERRISDLVAHIMIMTLIVTLCNYIAYRENLVNSKKELTDSYNTICDVFFNAKKAEDVPGIKATADMMNKTPLLQDTMGPFTPVSKCGTMLFCRLEHELNIDNKENLKALVMSSIAINMVLHTRYLPGKEGIISVENLRHGDQVFCRDNRFLEQKYLDTIKRHTGRLETISDFLNVFVRASVCKGVQATNVGNNEPTLRISAKL